MVNVISYGMEKTILSIVLKIVPFDFVFVVVVRSNSLENVDHARLSLAIKKMPLG